MVDAGGIRQAAARVHLSQPALTRSIHALEEALGVVLFERGAHGMTLTPSGEALLFHARAIAVSAETAQQEIAQLAAGQGGTLRLGAGAAWAVSYLPLVIAELQNTMPHVRVQFYEWVTERTLPMLADGQLDVVVGGVPPPPQQDKRFVYEPLMEVQQHVFAHSDHPLQRKRNKAADLLAHPWIWFREASLSMESLKALLGRGDATLPVAAVETTSMSFGLQLLAQNAGHLMMLPSTLEAQARRYGLKPLRLVSPLATYPAGLIFRPGTERLGAFRSFRDILMARVAT